MSEDRIFRIERGPVRFEIPVQWGDMDALGHVNNATYFRWFESARIAYFEAIGWLEHRKKSSIGPILHSATARFRLPLTYPDTITVTAAVADLAVDRFTMQYEIRSRRHKGALAAEGTGLIVAYDYRSLAKAVLPEEIAARIRGREALPIPSAGP